MPKRDRQKEKRPLEERVLSVLAHGTFGILLRLALDFLGGGLDVRAVGGDRGLGLCGFGGLGLSQVLLCLEGGDAAGSWVDG